MNKSRIRCLVVGWVGTMAWLNLSQALAVGGPEPKPQIAVYIYNWAQVEPKTLQESKEVAARIFQKAGVEATLLDAPPPSAQEQGQMLWKPGQTNFFVQILSLPMAKSFGLPTQILGTAPGDPQERNRDQVYLLGHVAKRIAQDQVVARQTRTVFINASLGQIMGHGIAHEIGHVLLHQSGHSPAGLMRAQWDRKDFENMVGGNLHFTSEETERVRAEVSRRNAANRE